MTYSLCWSGGGSDSIASTSFVLSLQELITWNYRFASLCDHFTIMLHDNHPFGARFSANFTLAHFH